MRILDLLVKSANNANPTINIEHHLGEILRISKMMQTILFGRIWIRNLNYFYWFLKIFLKEIIRSNPYVEKTNKEGNNHNSLQDLEVNYGYVQTKLLL